MVVEIKEENFTPFNELMRYADEFSLHVEIEKPFKEFDQLFLKVVDSEGNEIKRVVLQDITNIDKESSKLLNELSKKGKN